MYKFLMLNSHRRRRRGVNWVGDSRRKSVDDCCEVVIELFAWLARMQREKFMNHGTETTKLVDVRFLSRHAICYFLCSFWSLSFHSAFLSQRISQMLLTVPSSATPCWSSFHHDLVFCCVLQMERVEQTYILQPSCSCINVDDRWRLTALWESPQNRVNTLSGPQANQLCADNMIYLHFTPYFPPECMSFLSAESGR